MNSTATQYPASRNKPESKKKSIKRDYSAFANITEQNASDAAFLWLLRSNAVSSKLYYSADIQELDNRLEGNLQGLSAVGEQGWQACTDQLVYEEPGEVFTAAVVALRSRNASRIKMVCELGLKSPETTKGLISAMGWIEKDIAQFWIQRFLSVSDPSYRLLGLATCSVRQEDPGKYFLTILQDPTIDKYPHMYARALRLIGELKRYDLLPALNAAMDNDDQNVSFWANWSAVMLGNQSAILNLKPFLFKTSELTGRAIQMVFSSLPVSSGKTIIGEMVKQPELARNVIKAIGVLGDPHAIPWLIQNMSNPEFARIAGEAFSQITGIDLESAQLHIEQSDDNDTGPNDDADDENVSLDEDEDLAWPDVKKISRLWQVHNLLLQSGLRYFQGQEVTKQVLAQIFVNANQQQKQLAALQRAILDKNTTLVNIRAREI